MRRLDLWLGRSWPSLRFNWCVSVEGHTVLFQLATDEQSFLVGVAPLPRGFLAGEGGLGNPFAHSMGSCDAPGTHIGRNN